MNLYLVYLVYELNPGRDEWMGVGNYTTREKAEQAVQRVRWREGFRDLPVECFGIFEIEVDRDYWAEGHDQDHREILIRPDQHKSILTRYAERRR